MQLFYKICFWVICFMGCCNFLPAQFTLSGTVFDSTKINFVPNVKVINKEGKFTYTDSLGKYSLRVNDVDSVTFSYKNKSTQKFSVQTVSDPSQFDICLKIPYYNKYHSLKEVIVYTKSYREDSVENRKEYANIYSFQNPTIHTSTVPGGGVGMDADELINMFRFKRNKRLRSFQNLLVEQEKEKYITSRFNKNLVHRITHLDGEQLNTFLIRFRPSYQFCATTDAIIFNQYILNCSYTFKVELLKQQPSIK